jgi:hypothetical protein
MVRRITPLLGLVGGQDRRQIQLIDQIPHEVRQVIVRQPLAQTRWQQQRLLGHVGAVRLGHACYTIGASRMITRTRS